MLDSKDLYSLFKTCKEIKQLIINSLIFEVKTYISNKYEQLSVFSTSDELENNKIEKEKIKEEDKNLQKTILNIKNKYGKNSVLKGMDYEEGGTTRERNKQIGGHKA